MRLYKQELLRIIKSTRTRVVIVLAILLPIVLALLATEFNDANYWDNDGNTISLHGTDALKFIEESSESGNGEVTIDRLKEALGTYQRLYDEYGMDPLGSGFPLNVYWEQVNPIRPMLRMITQAYSPVNESFDLYQMDPDELDSFYDDCGKKLAAVMQSDDILKDPEILHYAETLYKKVEAPFAIFHGYTRDAFDYIEFTIFVLAILSASLAAPVFSERYASGEDSVLRCTVFGRRKFVRTTFLAELTVVSGVYLVGIGAHLLLSDTEFGFWTLKESVQSLYTVYSLPSMNLFELQIALAFAGWICCVSVASASLCISSIVSETSTAMVLSLMVVFIPTLLYSVSGNASWLIAIFPSASIGLSNNMLMSLVDLRFLTIGNMVFWYPVVLMVTAIAGGCIFWMLAHLAYSRHQITR